MKSLILKSTVIFILLLVPVAALSGCGPKPPVKFQTLQIQDSDLSRGYDMYQFVSIHPDTSDEDVETLLKWFDEVKYPAANKIGIYVWNNPQAALTSK